MPRGLRRKWVAIFAVLAFLGMELAGCAAGPPRGWGPMRGSDAPELPPPITVLVRGAIVDVNAGSGTMTVKDEQDHDTWTVVVTEETRFTGGGGAVLTLDGLRVGEKVQIRGTTRIDAILRADEITQIDAAR